MSIFDPQERVEYWHKKYREANRRANAAIAEAKKSKERELTAIRLTLKQKDESLEAWRSIARIRVLYETAETQEDLNGGIYEVLKELSND